MTEHPKDDAKHVDQRPTIDPLRRVFVPSERPIFITAESGDRVQTSVTSFSTIDGQQYRRLPNGEIRRVKRAVGN